MELTDPEGSMTSEEKRAWIMVLVAPVAYLAYVVVILGRASGAAITAVPYVSAMLWTIGSAIVIQIVLHIAVTIRSHKESGPPDQRDKDISRFGEYVGQSLLVIGGVTALILAMAEVNHFWIANAIYLSFVLSALLGSATKIIAYRRGFHPW